MADMEHIETTEQLAELYGEPNPLAISKELDHINALYRAFIEKAPFVVIATSGPDGLDCSPRGDPAGFARVKDEHTVLIPDRRGNNRVDTLSNIVRDGRISLLFLIPGVNETLRINGRAKLSVNSDLCESFSLQGKTPRSVIVVSAERVYYQCPKALVRSKLWDADAQVERSEVPTGGQMIQAIDKAFDGETWDRNYPEHQKTTIY